MKKTRNKIVKIFVLGISDVIAFAGLFFKGDFPFFLKCMKPVFCKNKLNRPIRYLKSCHSVLNDVWLLNAAGNRIK